MKLPIDFPKEYTLFDLTIWFKENRPDAELPAIIEVTYDQEMHYRSLLLPEFYVPRIVTFRGVPLIVYEL